MKTVYYVLLLTTVFIQTACRNNSNQVQPAKPALEETYTLVSIQFTALPGSTTEEITEPRPSLQYANGSSVRQKILIDPDGIFERSTFKKAPNQDYLIEDHNQRFSVPIEIQDDRISLGAKKWTYNDQETKLPTQVNFKDSVFVEPGKKLIGKLSISYKKIKAAYTAQLKGQSSGKPINVNGIWTGTYPLRKNFTYSTQDL